jgi:hypothetical protein
MARPTDGLKHVERLDGPEYLKRQLRVVLETVTGERSVAEACAELKVSKARLHRLRRQVLEGALEGLRPRRPGRPRKPPPVPPTPREELEAEVKVLREELKMSEIREEIARTMPHLVRRGKKSKTPGNVKRRRRKAREQAP